MMKRIILIAVLIFLFTFAFAGCADDSAETTGQQETTQIPDEITSEETTKASPTVYEMSPGTMDISVPIEIVKNTSAISFSYFANITAEDSYLSEIKCDKILKNDNAEYYFVESEKKIIVIIFDENEHPAYSASYNIENGALEFLGDDTRTWYFNEDGTLNCMVFEYKDDEDLASVYTFYTPEGNRDLVRINNSYYDGEVFPLSEQDALRYIQKYSHTIEVVN